MAGIKGLTGNINVNWNIMAGVRLMVTAVIPAYNEEKTIAEVVRVVQDTPQINEVVVVSDGSTDATAAIARSVGAKVIELPENGGKGRAMMVGAAAAANDFLVFLDADLIGLNDRHVTNLIRPVISGEADMSLGIFDRGRLATDLAQFFAPGLTGQRALRREILLAATNLEETRYGIEMALNRYAEKLGLAVQEVELPDLSHVMKEEKLGFVKGFAALMKMYWEIARYARR